MNDQPFFVCPQCQIGHLTEANRTYVLVHRGMIVSVPDVPALTCDVCGLQEFEPETIIRLEALLRQSDQTRGRKRLVKRLKAPDSGKLPPLKP